MTPERSIQQIASVLTRLIDESGLEKNTGLLGGYPGISLFYYGHHLLTGSAESLAMAERIVAESLERIDLANPDPYFCNGLAGIAYLLDFYRKRELLDLDEETAAALESMNGYLYRSCEHALKAQNFDFLHGGVGLLSYLVLLEDRERACELLLESLNDTKERIPNKGIAWRSNISDKDGNRLVYNLGLAHGMAGTLLILAKIVRSDCVRNQALARELLSGCVDFFLSERLGEGFRSTFSNYSSLDEPPRHSRLAWCYGDPGISIALWRAGEALRDGGVQQAALDICLRTTRRRTREETGVVDAGICHGSSGIAQIYRRMHALTGHRELREAAAYWLNETLSMAKFEDGWAGYKTWTIDGGKNDATVLDGISGIGLVLVSSQLKEELAWDECLLLS